MLTRLIPPPVALLVGIGLIFALSESVPAANLPFPGDTWIAGGLFAIGLGLMLAAARALQKAHTTINPIHPERASHLVTSGIYRRTRNPIYLGDTIILLGMIFWFSAPLGLLVVAAFVSFIDRFQIRGEEQALTRLFGDGFARYCQRAPRWL